MEQLEQQLAEVSLVYTSFEDNLNKIFEGFQGQLSNLISNNDGDQTPNPKGKRAKHMATIHDDPDLEEVETSSVGDTSVDSQRSQRSTRNKNATSYKEPPLNTKIRRPSPLKSIKTERVTIDGKENTAPNNLKNDSVVVLSEKDSQKGARSTRNTNKDEENTQKRKSNEEGRSDVPTGVSKKLSEIEIIESPTESVTIISDDETEKMPPPTMPPPKARGRPRTRKATKESITEDNSQVKTRVKQERPSVASSETISETTSTRSTRTKSKKIPLPIVEVKHEKVSLENANKRTSAGSESSVYEDAQAGSKKVSSNTPNATTTLDATYTKPDTPNSTVTIENATFNVPANVNNETFQVQSPQDANGTYTVPLVPTPNPHDSIMTEDRSDDESLTTVAQPVKSIAALTKLQSDPTLNKKPILNSKKYEIFNPNIPSPIKAKVQAFEKFTAASASSNGFMSPTMQRMPPLRHFATPGSSKLTTPSSLPKIVTPLLHTAPALGKSSSTSKLAHVQKKVVSKQSSTSTASSRDPSVEDLKRTTAAIAEKKKTREEKQRLAQQQREQLEKERRERARLAQKEKEEKHRKLLQEKEDRKREMMTQKKLDEYMRNQKIMEQKRRELAEKEALELAKAKQNESLQRKVLQKQHSKKTTKHDFDVLDTDDSTDDEGKMNKNRGPPPIWSKGSFRRNTIREQTFLNLKLVDTFFSVQPMTPDLKEIFPAIEPKKLKRNSSAVWNTPPRYSTMPKY